jgi:hypothetical protein
MVKALYGYACISIIKQEINHIAKPLTSRENKYKVRKLNQLNCEAEYAVLPKMLTQNSKN